MSFVGELKRRNVVRVGIACAVIYAGLAIGCASAVATDADGRLYQPSEDALADVQQALSRAEKSDRRLLVVTGANWCHDSRALASRLHTSPLAESIQENYELVFVDVGFYETGREVLQEFGVPHFYATPTVLIVDPASRQSVNDEDRHIWGNAYNIDMSTSVQYFEKWATSDPVAESAELGELYAEIDQFELQLAERVAVGYAVVGPLLEARVAGDAPEEFDASWDELRDFRMAIPADIRELREEAQQRVSEGEDDIRLAFPEYPLLSWEVE